MAFALQARFVFPVDRPPIENGVVTIDGERIVAVGTTAEAGEVIDLGDVVLLPGFVNCHTHLEFSGLRRPLGSAGMRLVDWIRLVIAERGRSEYAPAAGTDFGLRESLARGVTAIGDITTIELSAFASVRTSLTLFTEIIGFSRARANSAFAALDGWLLMRDAMRGLWTENIQFGISPHAPYTVSPKLLQKLIGVARDRKMPMAMHLAESVEELELLDTGTGPFQQLLDERSMWDDEAIPRGSRPMDYLRMFAEAPHAIVIHGNYLADDEQSFLGANRERLSLVYCPRTHAYFHHPPYPLTALLGKNVRVALGTDSRASNPDLDLLAEMRYVASEAPATDPVDILRMGTLAGAEVLKCDTEFGSITPGKLANLVAIRLANSRGTPRDALSELLASGEPPCGVWLRGVRLTS